MAPTGWSRKASSRVTGTRLWIALMT
uniref:Initiation factor eIF-4A long form n=1 Tax=Mus musculus TaxID=10090 RepID=Q64341_MOUSE|nr:unnamed protein product [Mus musculus]CAA26844.1 unnamed protein product [Mus musculus]